MTDGGLLPREGLFVAPESHQRHGRARGERERLRRRRPEPGGGVVEVTLQELHLALVETEFAVGAGHHVPETRLHGGVGGQVGADAGDTGIEQLTRGVARWLPDDAPRAAPGVPAHGVPAHGDSTATVDRPEAADGESDALDAPAVDALVEAIGGERVGKAIGIFIADAGRARDEIAGARAARDLARLATALHRIKSSGAVLGGRRFSERAQTVEHLARGTDPDAFDQVALVLAELDALVAALRHRPEAPMAPSSPDAGAGR